MHNIPCCSAVSALARRASFHWSGLFFSTWASINNAVRTIYWKPFFLKIGLASIIWSHPLRKIMNFSCASPALRSASPRWFGLLSCLTLGILQFPHQFYSPQACLFPSSCPIQVATKEHEQIRPRNTSLRLSESSLQIPFPFWTWPLSLGSPDPP